jgi:hypothetical protein
MTEEKTIKSHTIISTILTNGTTSDLVLHTEALHRYQVVWRCLHKWCI